MNDERRQVLLNALTKLELREIRIGQTDVVDLPFHAVEFVDRVQKGARDIAHVDEIPLEVAFEEHNKTIGVSAIGEVVHEQVEPHPRRHAEHRRQPQADRRRMPLEQRALDLNLVAPVQRYRPYRCVLGAVLAGLAHPVAAVGHRQQHALLGAQKRQHVDDRAQIRGGGGQRIAVAQGSPDQRRERNDDVGVLQ